MGAALELYHGTSSVFIEEIKRKGLIPSNETGIKNYPNVAPYGHQVFLALTLEEAQVWGWNTTTKHKGNIVVVRVRVDTGGLIGEYHEHNGETAIESLTRRQRCAYLGKIPHIEGYQVFDIKTKLKIEEFPQVSLLERLKMSVNRKRDFIGTF